MLIRRRHRLGPSVFTTARVAPLWGHGTIAGALTLARGFTLMSMVSLTYPTGMRCGFFRTGFLFSFAVFVFVFVRDRLSTSD